MQADEKVIHRAVQVKEILRCGEDPTYFLNTYVKIRHPQKGEIPFKTYEFQDECIQSYNKHRFNIVLKSRQLGLSTISAGYATWMCLFMKDKDVLVIATKLPTAVNFIKKVKGMLESIPKWLLMTEFKTTTQSVSFSNGSNIKAIPTSEDAGRSEALSLLIIDEAAHIRDFENIYTGIYPTLSEGGSAIILSTPNGAGGLYHQLWRDAAAGVNDYNAIKLPWWCHPDHDQAWFDKETKNMSARKVSQEYLCEFLTSGDTFLQSETFAIVKAQIKQPIDKKGPRLGVWIWEKPQKDKKYVLTSDVSRGDAFDFSTFHIFDYDSFTIVAEYLGKIAPDKLGELINEFGLMYNTALACIENNSFGIWANSKLIEMSYPNIYYPEMENNKLFDKSVEVSKNSVPGFLTSTRSRQQILPKLEEVLRNAQLKVVSQRLFDQLSTFTWVGNRAQAANGACDDLVMSAAIGSWLCASSQDNVKDENKLLKAMLDAQSIVSRDITSLPVQSSIDANTNRQLAQKNYGRAHNINDRFHRNIGDFSWLLK